MCPVQGHEQVVTLSTLVCLNSLAYLCRVRVLLFAQALASAFFHMGTFSQRRPQGVGRTRATHLQFLHTPSECWGNSGMLNFVFLIHLHKCAKFGRGCLELRFVCEHFSPSGWLCLFRMDMFSQSRLQGVGRTRGTHASVAVFMLRPLRLLCLCLHECATAVLNLDVSVHTFRLVAGFAFSAWVRFPKVACRVLGELEEPVRVCCNIHAGAVETALSPVTSLSSPMTLYSIIFMYPDSKPCNNHISYYVKNWRVCFHSALPYSFRTYFHKTAR